MGNVCGCSGKGEQLLTAVEAEDKEAVQEILHAQSPKATRQLARYNSFVSRRTPLLCAAARGNAEVRGASWRSPAPSPLLLLYNSYTNPCAPLRTTARPSEPRHVQGQGQRRLAGGPPLCKAGKQTPASE